MGLHCRNCGKAIRGNAAHEEITPNGTLKVRCNKCHTIFQKAAEMAEEERRGEERRGEGCLMITYRYQCLECPTIGNHKHYEGEAHRLARRHLEEKHGISTLTEQDECYTVETNGC